VESQALPSLHAEHVVPKRAGDANAHYATSVGENIAALSEEHGRRAGPGLRELSPPRRDPGYSNVMLKRALSRAREDSETSFLSNHHCHGRRARREKDIRIMKPEERSE
jgi:hypothetical protein